MSFLDEQETKEAVTELAKNKGKFEIPLDDRQLLIVGGLILFIVYLAYTHVTDSFMYLIPVSLIFIAVMKGMSEGKNRLSEDECRNIAKAKLRRWKNLPGFPKGKIIMPEAYCTQHSIDGESKYYEFYYIIKTPRGKRFKGSIAIHNSGEDMGDLKKNRPRPYGWTGNEAPDIIKHYIPVPISKFYNPRQGFESGI